MGAAHEDWKFKGPEPWTQAQPVRPCRTHPEPRPAALARENPPRSLESAADRDGVAKLNAKKVMRLPALEFLRRFLLHVLPKGFQRIRYYGFLANRIRGEALETVRALIDEGCGGPQTVVPRHSPAHSVSERACPECEDGILVIVTDLAPTLPCGSPSQRRTIPP